MISISLRFIEAFLMRAHLKKIREQIDLAKINLDVFVLDIEYRSHRRTKILSAILRRMGLKEKKRILSHSCLRNNK